MFAVFDIDPREIKQVHSITADPSRLTTLGHKIDRLARKVKKEWNSFSVEEREAMARLAYDLLEPPKGVGKLWLRLRAKAYTIFIIAINQVEVLYFCLDAVDTLIDNILDAVEREDPVYQQVLSDTLEEVISNPGAGEPVDADRRREWLKQLSSEALK